MVMGYFSIYIYIYIYIPPLLDTREGNHQAGWSVCTTLWEALGLDALRLATFYRCTDLVGCVPDSSGSRSRCTFPRHPRASGGRLQALSLLGGASFIARHLQYSFLEECWPVLRIFGRVWATARVPWPHLKEGLVPYSFRLVGRVTNTENHLAE